MRSSRRAAARSLFGELQPIAARARFSWFSRRWWKETRCGARLVAFIGIGTRDRKVSTGFSGSGSELWERTRPGYGEEEGTARGVGMSAGNGAGPAISQQKEEEMRRTRGRAGPLAGPSEGGEASRPGRGMGLGQTQGLFPSFFSFLFYFLFPKHFPNRTLESN